MRSGFLSGTLLIILLCPTAASSLRAQRRDGADPRARLEALKDEAVQGVEARAELVQRVVDQIFSYGELGFQEIETSRYLIALLRREGFAVDTGVAGIPTAWVARWGQGRPVIALGSDIDGIPQASQVPGVACRLPLVEGAPGHGEGHNSGQAVNLAAAFAVKRIMERESLPGTLVLWPGVAEEQIAGKPFLVRAGVFTDVDVVLFSHVGSEFGTSWGLTYGSGLVSVLYRFTGTAAHAAGRPWQGRSALDAVELMEVGWNFRREHLPLKQRSHSVIVDGGDQPNVVPQTASVWYYLRELDYRGIKALWAVADSVAQGAALMTGTTLLPSKVLGAAWPRHYNRPMAEAMAANIARVGMPSWTADDQAFARAVQRAVGQADSGLKRVVDSLDPPADPARNMGGPSDDIGDVSWTAPTVVLYYPANVGGLPGHHWSNAYRPQGVGRRCQGSRDDAARSAAAPGAGGQRACLLSRRADPRGQVPAADPARGSAPDRAQPRDSRALPPGDAALLLRAEAPPHLPGAARRHLSGAAGQRRGVPRDPQAFPIEESTCRPTSSSTSRSMTRLATRSTSGSRPRPSRCTADATSPAAERWRSGREGGRPSASSFSSSRIWSALARGGRHPSTRRRRRCGSRARTPSWSSPRDSPAKDISTLEAGMLSVTTPSVEGRRVTSYLGIVSGEAILGANIFRDFFAGIRDIVGGRSAAYEEELRKAKAIAMEEMESQAKELGANAVLAVDLDYETIQVGSGGGMLMVSASGTAVVLG